MITPRQITHAAKVGPGDASALVTSSITPASDEVLMLAIHASARVTFTVSGCGLSWGLVASVDYDTRSRLLVFTASGSAPSAGAVTITPSSTCFEIAATISGFTGVSRLGSPVSAHDSNPISATVPGLAASSSVSYAAVGVGSTVTPSNGSGWTLLDAYKPDEAVGAEYAVNNTAATWTPGSVNSGLVAVELVALPAITTALGGPNAAVEVVVVDPFGAVLAVLDELELAGYTRGIGEVGSGFVTFADGTYPSYLFPVDGRLEFWRDLGGGRRVLDTETSFLIRRFEVVRDTDGTMRRTVSGPSAVEILSRRIDTTLLQSSDGTHIDDIMHSLVRGNFTGRTPYATDDLFVEANRSLGPTSAKITAFRNILELCNELRDESLSSTPVFFDVVRYDARRFSFATYLGQRGADRGSTSGSPVTFSAKAGGLAGESLVDSYEGEITDVYGTNAKSGVGSPTRRARSPLNRRESYLETTNDSNAAQRTADLKAELNNGRPTRTISAQIINTPPAMVYGRDWGFGDRVVAEIAGDEFDVWVNAISFTVDGSGEESVFGKVEAVDAIG